MRWRASADEVELDAGADRLHHAVPGAGQRRADAVQHGGDAQHRLDRRRARARPRACSATRSAREAALAALDARVLEARPAAALFHPYIHEAGERGPFVEASARAHVHRPLDPDRLRRPGAQRLRGPRLRRARLLRRRWATLPDEVRVAGGAARSRALQDASSRACSDVPIRDVAREESGRRRLRHDGRGRDRRRARHGRRGAAPGSSPLLGDRDHARSGARRRLRRACSRSTSRPGRRCRRSGAASPRAAREDAA